MKLRGKLTLSLLIACLLALYIVNYEMTKKASSSQKLTIYTYSSFASSWGPGNLLRDLFQKERGIDLQFVDVGEAGLLAQRLQLEGKDSKADVILGLDAANAKEVQNTISFEPVTTKIAWDETFPIEDQTKKNLVAYSWAPITLVYRKSDQLGIVPKKLEDLLHLNSQAKIVLFDPQTSTPGYIVFEWIFERMGPEKTKTFFDSLKKNILTVTPSWTAGYGLFKKKQAELVFSYTTSPLYHRLEEKDFDYQSLILDEPQPYHVEYVGVPSTSPNKELAKQFLDFLFEPNTQAIIMNKNYMLPVVDGVKTATPFDHAGSVPLFHPKDSVTREKVFEAWKSIQW